VRPGAAETRAENLGQLMASGCTCSSPGLPHGSYAGCCAGHESLLMRRPGTFSRMLSAVFHVQHSTAPHALRIEQLVTRFENFVRLPGESCATTNKRMQLRDGGLTSMPN
jgi:hypothetical protein